MKSEKWKKVVVRGFYPPKEGSLSFFILLFSLFFLLRVDVFSQSGTATFPRITPDPKAVEFFQRGGRGYSWTDLAEIGLWASGGDASYVERIRAMAGVIANSPEFPATDRGKAEFILGYLHKNLLKTYSLNQTRVDTVFVNGTYNCVSSAVLYIVLCKSAGLDVTGVVTRDHSFVTVRAGGESIDVETTNPYGFDPGNRREFHDQFGRVTGFAYVPARNYRNRQDLTPIELVSLIIFNRIAELESRNRFSDAVPLAVDRLALLSGAGMAAGTVTGTTASDSPALFENPRKHLMDRIFNYGAFLLRSGKEDDCLRWAAVAAPVYPDDTRWPEFTRAAVNNRITRYVRAGQFADAGNFLAAQRDIISPADFAQFDSTLVDTELLNATDRIRSVSDGDNVVNSIEQARSNGRITDGRARELLTFAVQKTASVLSAAPGRDWLSAIHYIENAVARFGTNRELEQALQTYRTNRATDFHNRFAAAWNRKNFDEARRILDEGIAEFPTNRQLLTDRETVNKSPL